MDTKSKIIEFYLSFIKNQHRTPTWNDLYEAGFTREQVRHYFRNKQSLRDAAFIADKKAFDNILDEKVFTPKRFKELQKSIKQHSKFIITTAVTGMPLHEKFYNNLKHYCKKNNAALLILPSSDPAINGWELDGRLQNEHIVFDDLALNSNLFISSFKTSSKQTNPLTGIKRIGQRERSMIIASPKQFLEYVPTANDKYSHALMTTGAITLPTYRSTERYMSQRTAYIAEFDHKIGAIVVDIKGDKYFQFRQLQAEYGTGRIIDLGNSYNNDKITTERPEGLVCGDIHVNHTDPLVLKGTDDLIRKLKPKKVFLHDVCEAESVNHHIENQMLTKAKRTITLKQELISVKNYLDERRKLHPYVEEWVIIRSNHDDFIDRYLQTGDYVEDSINSEIAHEIALTKLKKSSMALEVGLEIVGLKKDKLKFLNINDSYKINGIECGVHGHMGLNGSKSGTNASMEIGYGAGVFGHSHTAGILRDVYRVGTSTKLRMGYNHGASNWTQTHCLIYKNGARQLVNFIEGKWN